MGVKFQDLKEGTIFLHDSGYVGEVLSVNDSFDIRVRVIKQGCSDFPEGTVRNAFLSRIEDILSLQQEEIKEESEAETDAYEVEIEMPGQIIFRMDYKHFEKFLKTIQK